MENMSPQQQQDSLSRSRASLLFGDARSSGQNDNKRRMKTLSHRRQSAPSLVISKALTRSRTLSRDYFQAPFCPETCPLVQSFLVWSDRVFLLHGHAQLKTGLQTQDRHLFLFNNMLVIAKAKSGNQFKQKAQVRVCEMWTTSGSMEEVCEGGSSPESSFVIGWPTCNYVAMFSSTDQKEKWLSLLKSRIKEEKEKEEPKTIALKVYGKGINSLADGLAIKTLAVSNSDTTNEVVRLALQQFGIAVSTGNVKDYQLWVFSKKDNAPYPLIGHEYPFSIQMGHVREPPSQGNKDGVQTPDRQMPVQAELLQQASKQCQFILKRRPASQQHEAIELSQKPFKRKRSIINWAFWKGSSSQLDDSTMSLSSPASGCLFGQPLSSIFLEDALPQTIMDMLVFLYHEGSWTRGIFRRSAGAKAVRELRDSLDSGFSQLPLTRDHVFVIAGVFKDFLRSIPGSLLCSERYEEWMDILDESQGVEEQAQDIQRLIVRLPTQNVVLLRHLLCLLHGIQANAPDNQMTSFNLSVCIAPSLLWPPGTCSPQLEGEMAKKVCDLVKFMIDHCQKITGQNPTTLFGGPPQSHSTKDHQSDPWPSYPLTDSSFDSLENELDDYSGGSGGSPSFPTGRQGGCRKNKALQGSLDSILTLSDNEQDAADSDVHRSRTHQATRERCLLQLPPAGRPRSRRPAHPAGPIISQEGSPTGSQDLSSSPEDRCYSFRRRSEPAIAYSTELRACTIGSGHCLSREDGNNGDDNEGEHLKAGNHSQAHAETLLAARLSSPRTSPAPPTRSPVDSLPSTRREGASPTKRDPVLLAKTAIISVSTSPSATALTGTVSDSVPKDGAGPPGVGPPGPSGSPPPPRELPSKETLKSGRGLHPNVWLKDVRGPSLNQLDGSEKEDGERTGGGHTDQSVIANKQDPENGDLLQKLAPEEEGRMVILETPSSRRPQPPVKPESSSPPSLQGAPCPPPSDGNLQPSTGNLQARCPQPSHSIRSLQRAPCPQPSHSQLTVRQLRDIHTQACQQQQHTHHAGSGVSNQGLVAAAGCGLNELKLAVPQTMFSGQTSPALALFRKNKTLSLSGAEEDGHASFLSQRRSSEPDAAPLTAHLERFSRRAIRVHRLPGSPEDPRVSEVDTKVGQRGAKPPLCSSTRTTQDTVKDCFLSRPPGSPQSSQQMAPSLFESRKEAWLRRCSDPMAPPPEAEPDGPQDLEQVFAEESFV